MTSLTTFFDQADPATLNNCDKEPIHLAGAIQAAGAMLVLDARGQQVTGASENAASFLGVDAGSLFGGPLKDALPDLATALARSMPLPAQRHTIIDAESGPGNPATIVAHGHDSRVIVEFLPAQHQTLQALRRRTSSVSSACAEIMLTGSWHNALQVAADCVRDITGISRVKIYRFHPDWSGEVVAESRAAHMPSYLGLFFPDTDIPRQARELYRLNPARAVGEVHDRNIPILTSGDPGEQLDLTYSLLRAVSPIHTQYLRNIGVGSSFSCRLMNAGRLWGLIACHHDEPLFLPFDDWRLVEEVATFLMLRDKQQVERETAARLVELRKVERQFATEVQKSGAIENAIETLAAVVRQLFQADGFAMQVGTALYRSGSTPPEGFIRGLLEWAEDQEGEGGTLATNRLHDRWPAAADHMDTACGVLIQPIRLHQPCQLVWFRGPIVRTVNWAGKPQDKSGGGPLTPRNSFETWSEKHSDQSLDWMPSELESAREFLNDMVEIVSSQLMLRDRNRDLRQFASFAAHDIKAPLRGIRAALGWLREGGLSEEAIIELFDIAETSTEALSALTEGLTQLMVLENGEPELAMVDLNSVIGDARHLLLARIEEQQATVTVENLPAVRGNASLLTLAFCNIITNALNYRGAATPRISIDAKSAGRSVEVAIQDNGIGIAPDKAQFVFQPLKRIGDARDIEGTGLGLAICQRVLQAQAGSIWLDTSVTDGARFVMRLPAWPT